MAHLTTLGADSQVPEVTSELQQPTEQLGQTVFQAGLSLFQLLACRGILTVHMNIITLPGTVLDGEKLF